MDTYRADRFSAFAITENYRFLANAVNPLVTPLGQGNTDWAEMLRLIAPHVPNDSWVILEHVLSADEGRASLKLLRSLAEEAGVELA